MKKTIPGVDPWGFPIPNWTPVPLPEKKPYTGARGQPTPPGQLVGGLRKLCEKAKPGYKHTYEEIADACGVDKEWIRQIERRALRKLRVKLGPAYQKYLKSK